MENNPAQAAEVTGNIPQAKPCTRPFSEPDISPGAKKWIIKITLIIIAMVMLQIPLMLVRNLSKERAEKQRKAENDIAAAWGDPQFIAGIRSGKNHPETMSVKSIVAPEIRYRGIYQSVVYTSTNEIDAHFPVLDKDIILPVMTGANAIRDISAEINGKKAVCTVKKQEIVITPPAGINGSADCHIMLKVRGSGSFQVACNAKYNKVEICGDWDSPNFGAGSILPDTRVIENGKFSASWQINNLLTENESDASAGVAMHISAGTYQQVERCMTYATFFLIVFFFTLIAGELISKIPLHPMQYMVASGAPVLFYLMLLAIGEQSSFAAGYSISAAVIVLMVTGYARMFFNRMLPALLMGMVFAASYIVNYFILQMEDFALLSGTVVLAIVLGVLMILTGRINVRN